MKYQRVVLAGFLGIFSVILPAAAQTPTNRQRATRPAPSSTPPARPSATPARNAPQVPPGGTLAIVNGQALTLSDLNPSVREAVEGLEKDMPTVRKQALDARINTLLLESEATKRKVTGTQLMDAEVNNRIVDPTDAEIRAVYEANRAQVGNADLATVQPQIVAYLRGQAGQKLADAFIAKLRASHTVVNGTTDINAPNIPPTTVLATVDGKGVVAGDFEERLKPFLYKLRREMFDAEVRALDQKINQMLLETDARKRSLTPEQVFKLEVADKVHEPTEAEITKFYDDNKGRIKGDLATLRPDIANLLKDQQVNRLEAEFAQRLRKTATLQIFLKEPEPPVQAISEDSDPSRGDANAPVRVVVFTDFQCPSCAMMHPVIEEALRPYANRVRLVLRDFPLAMHPQARKAAEAANAANAQGKFFEYINVLFKNQSALDIASLKKYATDLGLDRAKFDASLDSGQYAEEVNRDVADGEAYGVDGTPSIFINGVRLRNLTPEGIRAAVDGALTSKATAAPKGASR